MNLKKRVLKNLVKLKMVKNQNKLANRTIYTDFYQSMLTGLETQEPILQIGRQVFAGTYSDSADTSVFFRCTAAEESTEDEVFSRVLSGLSAKLEWKTKKKLTFKRVFLKPVDHN